MSTKHTTRFRSIPEGQGRTFTFRKASYAEAASYHTDPQCIRCIGTSGVKTCVGVYFKLSDSKCFVAHINGYVKEGEKGVVKRRCKDKEGQLFVDEVVRRLGVESKRGNWVYTNPEIAKSLLIVCAEPETRSKREVLTGWWIIKGIREFLHLEDAPIERKAGFVVDFDSGRVQTLTFSSADFDADIDPPELAHYEAVYERRTYDWVIWFVE
ncbi:hypothetical protein LTR08_002095 [Meristemomyces frigidus]|nr:hypothetical protein LTR08_002095 [Meristemomyces frigidus]